MIHNPTEFVAVSLMILVLFQSGSMPVATVDGFVDADKAQNLCRRRKSPPIVEATSGSSGPGASFQTDSPPSSSMIPCHSPILNLSPNMSPESQPNSTSPVFELLDSSGRRTVQGRLSEVTKTYVPSHSCRLPAYSLQAAYLLSLGSND